LGPVGSFIANIVGLLTTNWVLTVSALIAVWASLTDYVVALVGNPKVQTAAEVFLAVLWTGIGIAYLVDRKRARIIKAEHDYRYGLTFEGLTPNYDPNRDDATLQFGIQFRNFSSGPIRYVVEHFDVRIGTRSAPRLRKGQLTSFLPRGGARVSNLEPFKK